MIKINLLEVAPPPTVRERGPVVGRANLVWIFVIALVVSFAIVGLFYKVWSGAVENLQKELQKQRAEQARLAAIKAENERYQLQLSQLEQRINTVQTLQASRVGPVEMLTALSNVVNRTSDLYLNSLTPQGERLVIRGISHSVDSMATFLASLHRSGYFDDVQLRQFFEDDTQNRVAYRFIIDCAYRPPTAPAAQPAPAGATPVRRTGM
jgi:Tfp pilus assembly protein PilN